MERACDASIYGFTGAIIVVLLRGRASLVKEAKTAAAESWTQPRTPMVSRLQGIWSNASSVPLERPKNLGAKEFYTPQEMAEIVKARAPKAPIDRRHRADVHYDFNQFALDQAILSRAEPANFADHRT